MLKRRLLYLVCTLLLTISMLGCQTAIVAYADSSNQTIKNAVKYFGEKNHDNEDHDKDHGKKEQDIKKYFNPLLSINVRNGRVELLIGLEYGKEVYRWTKGRFFTMSLVDKVLEDGTKWSFNEVWDYKDNDGKKVALGIYKIRVEFVPYNYTKLSGVNIKLNAEKQIEVTNVDVKQNVDVALTTKVVNRKLDWM